MKTKILKCVFKRTLYPSFTFISIFTHTHTHSTLVIISHFSGLFTINLKNSYLLVISFLSFGYKRF